MEIKTLTILAFLGCAFTASWAWGYEGEAEKAKAPDREVEMKIPNSGFEDTSLQGWIGSATVTVGENPHSGNCCIQQLYKQGGDWNCIQSRPPFIKCGGNRTCRLSVWCRNTVASGGVMLGVRSLMFKNGQDVTIKYNWKPVVNNIATWQLYSLVFKTPPECEAISIYFRVLCNVNAGEVFWDDVSLAELPDSRTDIMTVAPLKSAVFFKNSNEEPKSAVYDADKKQFVEINTEDLSLEASFDGKAKGMEFQVSLKPRYGACDGREYGRLELKGAGPVSVPLKLRGLQPGRYVVETKLLDGGKIVERQECPLIVNEGKIQPPQAEPIRKAEIDGDGNLLVNGKPLLMTYYYHVAPEMLGKMRTDFGASTAPVWGGDSIDTLCENVDIAWKSGVYSWAVLFHPAMYDSKAGKWKDEALVTVVKRLRGHPGLIGWDLIDEPDGSGNDEAMINELARVRALVHELDPAHPIWVNLCNRAKFGKYIFSSDFASYDCYPFPDVPLSLIEGMNDDVLAACGGSKPLISVLQTWSPSSGDRLPTYDELRAETYLCIAQGMKIFNFYSWFDPKPQSCLERSPEHQSYVQELVFEMQSLKGFLFAPTPPQPALKELSGKGVRHQFKQVDGMNYLLLVNVSDAPQSYKLALPGHSGGVVDALFEDGRQLSVKDGILEDSMKPLEIHIYRY